MIKKILYFSLLLFFSTACFAWSSTGHYIITTIAYSQLTPKAKANIDKLLTVDDPKHPSFARLIRASIWADWVKKHGNTRFNSMHYINSPYTKDKSPMLPAAKKNVVWAIKKSIHALQSRNTTQTNKILSLHLLLHLVGDVHQPFHCINRFSKTHRHGDNGANAMVIHDKYANNLHVYWDNGANSFKDIKPASHYKNIKKAAAEIMHKFPPSYFKNKKNNLNPADWAKESYNIAANFGYSIPENSHPTKKYQTHAKIIIEKRLALAGYRLARLLNHLFNY